MLNKNVINVLQTLTNVTTSGILKYPTTILNNPAGDVVIKLDMASLDSDEFNDLGIFNLPEFINTFNLFNEYDCSISDGIINISDKSSSVQYLTTSVNVLANFNKKENIFDQTYTVDTVASFEVNKNTIKQLKSASGVFKDLADILVTSQDGSIILSLASTNNFNARSNSFSSKNAEANTTKEFSIKIPAENFNSLPVSDYAFEVKYNAERDAYRLLAKSTEVNMEILLAIKK